MDVKKNKLPQNMQHLLMEIGEKAVLFRLNILLQESNWEVFHNTNDAGCDLVIINSFSNEKIKIEVKTRQRLYTTSSPKNRNVVHFTISENEYKHCDFVICYWFEENAYFIIPKSSLTKTSSNGDPIYKFIVRRLVSGQYDQNSTVYLNNWKVVCDALGLL